MIPVIQNSFVSGELSPSFLGRTDKPQYRNGASTMRNAFVRYQGGAYSRAGLEYCGMCKQAAPNNGGTTASQPSSGPPRLFNFQYSINQGFALEFGDYYMRILSQGGYVTETAQNVTAITQANPGVITYNNSNYTLVNGDWVYFTGIGGMTNLNGLTLIAQGVSGATCTFTDLFGNVVNTTNYPAFTTGGTLARIYNVASPYAAVDLPYLKVVQNANLMNLDCWNQITGTQYPPYTLQRVANTNWVFTQISFMSPIAAPSAVTVNATSSTTLNTWYSYEVTAVDLLGNESVASIPGYVYNNDISINAGSNTIHWASPGTNVSQFNIYAATPVYVGASASNPGFNGASYGLIGSSAYTTGTKFIDTNIEPDFTTSPPLNINPFPSPGSYPGTVQYFQQRLVHANTVNAPNTYNMSQPGLNNNFDYAIPTVDSDAITGTPWGIQVNGIQWMVPTITGLLMFMGTGVWLVNGGNSIAITPADQNAQLQSQIGCSATVFPLVVGIHVLYVQAKNSIVRDINYNFLYNVFTGTDITVFSNHLFLGYTLTQWCYAEEPYKIVWVVRNDGKMLSLTYIKEQEIEGWARHDTNGLFVSVCSVIEPGVNQDVSFGIEPPIDAVYTIVQRYIPGSAAVPAGKWVYYSERFNNRIWQNIEDCVCVDASLFYPLTFPPATLTASAAEGTFNITSTNIINGGKGLTNPQATAVDSSGAGAGATFTCTQVGGVLTACTPVSTGQDYTLGQTSIIVTDPTGNGAVVQPVITNDVTFTSSASAFTPGLVGSVIRTNGGRATIVTYVAATTVIGNVTSVLTQTIPNDPNNTPIPAITGTWSISTPITTVTGLNHLEGMQVTGLADGGCIVPQTVTNGSVTLQTAASAIVVGLPYTVQVQSMYLDVPSQTTTQGKRKTAQAVTMRLEGSRGVSCGANMPDASAQPNQANVPWIGMKEIKERNNLITAGSAIPLYTGDTRILIPGDWQTNCQIAVQNTYPLPTNLLALIPEVTVGDASA